MSTGNGRALQPASMFALAEFALVSARQEAFSVPGQPCRHVIQMDNGRMVRAVLMSAREVRVRGFVCQARDSALGHFLKYVARADNGKTILSVLTFAREVHAQGFVCRGPSNALEQFHRHVIRADNGRAGRHVRMGARTESVTAEVVGLLAELTAAG